jgi:thioredoxin 1
MRRFVLRCLILLAAASAVASFGLCATAWKLVLKNGKTVECDGAPIVVSGVYLFRDADGKDGSLATDQVDQEKTDRVNQVAPPPRQWRLIGETVKEAPGAAGVRTLSEADFDAEVLHSQTPVLVDFWAAWCGYCRKIEPSVASIAGEYSGRLKVGKLDVDRNRTIANRYHVAGLPTLLLFKQGRVVAAIRGYARKSEMVEMLQSAL